MLGTKRFFSQTREGQWVQIVCLLPILINILKLSDKKPISLWSSMSFILPSDHKQQKTDSGLNQWNLFYFPLMLFIMKYGHVQGQQVPDPMGKINFSQFHFITLQTLYSILDISALSLKSALRLLLGTKTINLRKLICITSQKFFSRNTPVYITYGIWTRVLTILIAMEDLDAFSLIYLWWAFNNKIMFQDI